MIDKQKMAQVVEQALAGMGEKYFLVDITVDADNVVEVLIDSMSQVTIDDCVQVNDAVLAAFDRDKEDFELTVASYGISEPFKVRRHYEKNLGGEVEVLTADGKKIKGVLALADAETFTVTVPTKVKAEGEKRPRLVDVPNELKYNEIQYIKNIIKF